jgi:hypothetical protein
MQLAKMNPRYLPAFIGLGLFLLAMLAACTAEGEVDDQEAQGVGEPATNIPISATISTELSRCVTLIAFLASNHWHIGGNDLQRPTSSSSRIHRTSAEQMFNDYCGSYIDTQKLEKIKTQE